MQKTTKIDGQETLQQLLREEFDFRKTRNPAYSMRAYARDLKLSAATLCQVLAGKRPMTQDFAKTVVQALKLSETDQQNILTEIEKQNLPSAKLKARPDSMRHLMTDDVFRLVADWYHYGILEVIELPQHKPQARWMAKRLGIQETEAKQAIERLKRLGIMEEADGRFRQITKPLYTPTGYTSQALRKFHRQILKKADEHLESENVSERNFSVSTLSIATEDMPKAKEIIKTFRRNLQELMQTEKKERAYCLSIQFFPLDRI